MGERREESGKREKVRRGVGGGREKREKVRRGRGVEIGNQGGC
jgi:hypothetical protein